MKKLRLEGNDNVTFREGCVFVTIVSIDIFNLYTLFSG